MKQKLYVRVAKRPGWRTHHGSRYKVDGSQTHIQHPLELSGQELRTVHLCIELKLPDELFDEPPVPVVRLEVEPGQAYTVEPDVAQVAVEPPADVES